MFKRNTNKIDCFFCIYVSSFYHVCAAASSTFILLFKKKKRLSFGLSFFSLEERFLNHPWVIEQFAASHS